MCVSPLFLVYIISTSIQLICLSRFSVFPIEFDISLLTCLV